mmetsp:Transcript_12117/g.34322  ORF Transcript_12117/g.34322 Transcript_12117/m.34322 type:complete len:208 (-) Transcript_12117:291-914(-)
MNVYGIRPETLHCQGNVPLPKEWEKVNRGRHILIAHVASERPEQRFRVDGRLADLTAALRGPDAWLRLHPVVQAPPVDPLQLAPAGAGLYQIVRQQRAVFAIADATRRLLLSAVFRAVAWRLHDWLRNWLHLGWRNTRGFLESPENCTQRPSHPPFHARTRLDRHEIHVRAEFECDHKSLSRTGLQIRTSRQEMRKDVLSPETKLTL